MRYFLLGPTASGKTEVSLELAEKLNAEIFSMDSMLVYRGMNIGTAKPTAAEQAKVPHHLLDLVSPSEEFSVAKYLEEAHKAEMDVRSRDKAALYVGGTGLYFKSLLFGLFDGPPIPGALRTELEEQLANGSRSDLREELRRGDPDLYGRLHENDDKRLLRGVETLRVTGQPLSEWQEQWKGHRPVEEPAAALIWDRSQAHNRVEGRFGAMMEEGLLEETRKILDGSGFGRSARQAIGYRQVLEHLEEDIPLSEATLKSITATRRLIRRQTTWIRNFPGIQLIPMKVGISAQDVGTKIANFWLS